MTGISSKWVISALGIGGVLLVGGVVLLTQKPDEPTLSSATQSVATNTETTWGTNATGTTADINDTKLFPEAEAYIKEKSEDIVEKEYGIPVKADIGTPTKENVSNNKWVLQVSFNSLGSDLFLTDGKEETPWMDHVRFDSELTAFEKTEKEQFSARQKTWSQTINDPTQSEKFINLVRTEYIPVWEEKISFLENTKQSTANTLQLFNERYGEGPGNIPEKYLPLFHNAQDLHILATDIISLIKMNLKIKEKTIESLLAKNVDATVVAANDEDRITLVIGWHEERLGVLLEKNKELIKALQGQQ